MSDTGKSKSLETNTYQLASGGEVVVKTPGHGWPSVAYVADLDPNLEFQGPGQIYPITTLEGHEEPPAETRKSPESLVVKNVRDQIADLLEGEERERFLQEQGEGREIVQLVGFRELAGAKPEARIEWLQDGVLEEVASIADYANDTGNGEKDDWGDEPARLSMSQSQTDDSFATGFRDPTIPELDHTPIDGETIRTDGYVESDEGGEDDGRPEDETPLDELIGGA